MDHKIEFCLLSHNEIEMYFSSLLAKLCNYLLLVNLTWWVDYFAFYCAERFFSWWKFEPYSVCVVYLLLTKDEESLWFDRVIWSQIFSTPSLDTILESFPNTITSGPGHTDVMPLSIVDEKRQLCDLGLFQTRRNKMNLRCTETTEPHLPPCFSLTLSFIRISIGLFPHSMRTSSLAWPGTA